MYVVKSFSELKKNPNALSQPPDGPNSGYLAILDEEAETYSFFGLFKNHTLKDMPFPQNKALTICYTHSSGDTSSTSLDDVMLIPVLNLPLSYNRYYAIKPHGNHKGEAFTCSTEEDMATCCFCRCVNDLKPKPFDARNVYQQFQMYVHDTFLASRGDFYAKSVASDGYPPDFMRRKGWTIRAKTPKNYKLDEAPGLNPSLRARKPDFNFPSSYRISEAVVVGKWYTPFMFVKESTLRDQVERSPFYEVTLEQKWEQIFTSQNTYHEGRDVNVDVTIDREMAYVGVGGEQARWDERNAVEGAVWLRSFGRDGGEEATVGLAVELVQRMKWEEERGGWGGGKERETRVQRSEKFEGNGDWKEYGCYVLVESFVIKRMDGSVVVTYDFRHTQHIKTIWN